MDKEKSVELALKVPWGHVAAKAWGDQNDSPVLVVHGILDNAGSFDRLLALLPANFYYVAIDLPGHGLSSPMPAGIALNYYSYVLAIKYVLDELQWEQAYYIGHSLGAHLGMYFTIVFPGRIKKLVQLDGIGPKNFDNEDLISRIRQEQNVAAMASKGANQRSYTKEEIIYGLKNLRSCALNSAAAEALFERAVSKVGDDAFCYNRDYRARISIHPLQSMDQCVHLMKQSTVEALIITADSTLPGTQYMKVAMLKALENNKSVKHVEVKGNHDAHNNYPERVADYICEFLNHIPSKL